MKESHWQYRIFVDRIYSVLTISLGLIALIPFFFLIWELFKNGLKQFNLDLFTQISPTPLDALLAQIGGEVIPGGILNGILGGLLILSIALILAVPIGIFSGFYLYETRNKFALLIQSCVFLMRGLPSLLIGIISYIWIVRSVHNFSALAGGVALAIIMLPIIIQSTLETLKVLPVNLKENGLALGGSYWSVMSKIIFPSARGGLWSGIIYAIGQVIGETAPLMVTALGALMINWDIFQPTTSISLLIYFFLNSPNMIDLVWATSLVLFLIVVILNITARYIYRKWKKRMAYE